MTSTPRLDATLCFVDEDRATLDAEDEEGMVRSLCEFIPDPGSVMRSYIPYLISVKMQRMIRIKRRRARMRMMMMMMTRREKEPGTTVT
jgi:hypothetical protein